MIKEFILISCIILFLLTCGCIELPYRSGSDEMSETDLEDHKEIANLIETGVDYAMQRDYENAIKYFDEAIRLDPDNAAAWKNKGIVFFEFRKNEEALDSLNEAIKFDPNDSKILVYKGITLSNLNKNNEAIQSLDEAIRIDPNESDAWYNKGVIFESLGKYDEAKECYDQTIRIDPSDTRAWNNMGGILYEQHMYSDALSCFEETIRRDPNDAGAWLNNGTVLVNLGRYDEAITSFDEAIILNPNDYRAWLNKATALHLQCIQSETIKAHIAIASERQNEYGDNKEAYLGNSCDFDKIINCLNEAIKLNPNNYQSWLNKGVTLAEMSKKEEAIKSLEIAISIDPYSDDARELKDKLLKESG